MNERNIVMEDNLITLNKAIIAFNELLGSVNKITLKGGVVNKKILFNDVDFTPLIEDEVTKPRIGIVLNRINGIKIDNDTPVILISKYIPVEVAAELNQKKINYIDYSTKSVEGERDNLGLLRY